MSRAKTKPASARGAKPARVASADVVSRKRGREPRAEPPDFLRLDDQLCFPICLAARLVVNAYRPLLDELGITYPQYLVLLVLWENDGLSVGAVGERLHLDTGTLTPLLKRMERQGLVTRRRNAKDDRVVENWLTDLARALKERAQSVPTQLVCNAGLAMSDVKSLKKAVEGFVGRLLPLQAGATF
jgi:DNA-binding MarR family transcriptional regulator